jgi:hypothetical protein
MSGIRYKVDDAEVRKALAALPGNLSQRVRKKGMRTALAPVREDLRRIWRSASFRGKPTHRRAIANATRIDVRRRGSGSRAIVVGEAGVVYGKKGGSRAAGMQRVWHLLEDGFRHVASNRRIPGRKLSTTYVMRNMRRILTAISRQTLLEARAALRGQP